MSLLLVYDGGCGFCRRCVRYLRERDLWGEIEALPNQEMGIEARTGVSREQLQASIHAIDADGRTWNGAAAINQALRALRGPYALVGRAGRLPLLAPAEALVYAALAPRRSLLSRVWSDPPPDAPRP